MNATPIEKAMIDDESLVALLDEVSAMVRSGRSLVPGLVNLDQSGMGKVGRAAKQARQRIEQGHPAADAIAELSPTHEAPIRIAMDIMARTGSTESIDELVHLIRDTNEYRRQIRLAAIYPILNVIIAAMVLFFIMPFVLTSVSETKAIGAAFTPTVTKINQTFSDNLMLATFAMLAVIGVYSLFLYWTLNRSIRSMDVQHDHATFCRWLQIQLQGSTETGQLISTSASVVGSQFADSWQLVAERIQGGSQTLASLNMPAPTPDAVQQCIVDLVTGNRNRQSIAADLGQLSALYEQTSRQRRSWWIHVLPNWVTSLLMIAIMATLLQTMLIPLWDLVREVGG